MKLNIIKEKAETLENKTHDIWLHVLIQYGRNMFVNCKTSQWPQYVTDYRVSEYTHGNESVILPCQVAK